MLTPKELYEEYSKNPCTYSHSSPTYTQLNPATTIFNQLYSNAMGAGTPINWLRIINFFKHVKYPCVQSAPGYDDILNTGTNKLAPTFKFLQLLDAEAYKEIQPTVRAGTSYSVRNCCDLTRACYFTVNQTTNRWFARMATEYLEYYGSSSLPDCLFLCGPDLVDPVISQYYRAPGAKVTTSEPIEYSGADDPDRSILENAAANDPGMLCFPMSSKGVAGANHFCYTPPESETASCVSCDVCPTDPISGEVLDPSHPCCNAGSIYYYNECCNSANKAVSDRLMDWSLWIKSDDGSFDGTILRGRLGEVLRHVGILERKIYHGYANFVTQCSGQNPPITLDDLFFEYFQSINGWNYTDNTGNNSSEIPRARTISLVLKASISGTTTSTDSSWILSRIKDLLYNGYGVMLLSNVGFNNNRDSTGVSYPDRVMYHTYNIIGYDDTKVDYDECVYVLQLPFGEWNSGGHPEWGPLPDGSFLVTESHLRCLVNYYPTSDFYGCRQQTCINSATRDCSDPNVIKQFAGCSGAGLEGRCDPYYCTPQQKAFGLVFAISLSQGFPKQDLNYQQFYPTQHWKEKLKTQTLYYK